jgi:hypothetical protein
MTDLMKLTRPEAEAKFGPLVFNNPFDVGLFVADEENPSSSRFVLAINAEDEVLALPYDYSEFDHGDWESNGLEILVDLLDAGLLPDDEYLQHVAMFVQTAVNAMQEQEATELFNPMVGIVVSLVFVLGTRITFRSRFRR